MPLILKLFLLFFIHLILFLYFSKLTFSPTLNGSRTYRHSLNLGDFEMFQTYLLNIETVVTFQFCNFSINF